VVALRLVALVAAAGCLSKPPRPAEDVDAAPGSDGGPSGDGGPGPVEGSFAADAVIGVQHAVARLDGDGRDDLVLLGRLTAAGPDGIFIVLGRDDRFLAGYDEFLPLPESATPYAIEVSDFLGGAALDLLVLARALQGDAAILAYEGHGDGTFAEHPLTGPATTLMLQGTLESPVPTYIFTARTGGDVRGFVYGSIDDAFTVKLPSWSAIDLHEAVPRRLPLPTGDSGAVQGMTRVPSASDGFDDFLEVRSGDVHWLVADGTGLWREGPIVSFGNPARRSVAFADLDGSGTVDAAAIFGHHLDFAMTIYPAGGNPPRIGVRTFSEEPNLADAETEAMYVGDLVGAAAPELLLLDAAPPMPTSGLRLYADLHPSGVDQIVPDYDGDDDDYLRLVSGARNRLLVGDFDGDGAKDIYPLNLAPKQEEPICFRALIDALTTRPCLVLCGRTACD